MKYKMNDFDQTFLDILRFRESILAGVLAWAAILWGVFGVAGWR